MAQTKTPDAVSSAKLLRGLFLEDEPNDVELAVAMLKRAGYALSFEVADSPEQFCQQLEQSDFDIILADYNLRTWTALDGLSILKQSAKDIPLVVVSGSLGDEAAVEIVKQGATDYILKDRLQRLPVVVERALRDKAHREEAQHLHEALQASETRYRRLFEAAKDGVLILDADTGEITDVNPFLTKLLGFSHAELLGRKLWEIGPSKNALRSKAGFKELQNKRHIRYEHLPLETRDGRQVDVEFISNLYHVNHQKVIQCNIRDITERKRAEEARRESERKYQELVEHANSIILHWTRDGRIIFLNEFGQRFFGYTEAEICGRHVIGTLVPETESGGRDLHALMDEICANPAAFEQNVNENMRRNGERAWIAWTNKVVLDQQGKVAEILSIGVDLTARKQAEEALRRSEANYRSLIQGATYGIFRCSLDGKFLTVNPALVAMLDYQSEAELLAANLVTDLNPDSAKGAQLLRQYREAGRLDGVEVEWKRKDGTLIAVRLSGRTISDEPGASECFEVIAEDLGERKRLEEQLRQVEKMETVGRLAGGVAHDFNNLLTIISGFSQLLLERLEVDDPRRAYVDEIQGAEERAAALTRQLLAFGRRQMLLPQVLDLNAIVAKMDKMLRPLLGEDIELLIVLPPDLGRVKADPGQIEQVLLNLAVNARDAMPGGGKLTLETANVDLDESYTLSHAEVRTGPYVVLAVSDTGCGMDAETQSHLFEPFFTTKGKGKGTGLGLATSYGIIQQSGGYIWVYSEPGQGTTVKIYLPRVQEVAESLAVDRAPTSAPVGSETILVVEDEASVRSLVRGLLGARGYTVLEASRADEALLICQQHPGPIHLLLTDVVMPQMAGPVLAEQLAVLRPEMRVLYMSGYTDHAVFGDRTVRAEMSFIQKPFTPEGLAQKVREILDGVQNASE